MTRISRPRRSGALAACALGLSLAGTASAFASGASGLWDMSLDDTSRRCRLNFRVDAADNPATIAMPAGCRRAMPILSTVDRWEAVKADVALIDDTGQPVLTFSALSDPQHLRAKGPEGETYELVAAAAESRAPAAPAAKDPATKLAQTDAAPQAGGQAPDPAAIPGRYDILRAGMKDSGCMLTLDPKAKGPKGGKKAALAPACRDHGIVIFNPAGWRFEDGALVLTAKKGHETRLMPKPDGTWAKDAKEGAALILRKM